MNKGRLYLSGGGSLDQTYEADKIIFQNIENILYIPFAWEADLTYESCRTWFEELINKYNIKNYRMLKNPFEDVDLRVFDLIYIGGGNTFKLLKELKESGLGKKIIQFLESENKIVYGGSAGAIIFGRTINPATIGNCSDENNVKLTDLSGFNLLDYDVHCHYISEKEENEAIMRYCAQNQVIVIAISEEAVVEVINRGITRNLGTGIVKFFE